MGFNRSFLHLDLQIYDDVGRKMTSLGIPHISKVILGA